MTRRNQSHVAIDARFTSGVSGGVGQAVLSLISGLAKLDGDEHYSLIVGSEEQQDLLRPYAGPNQRFVMLRASDQTGGRAPLKPSFKRALNFIRKRFASRASQWPGVPVSNGF